MTTLERRAWVLDEILEQRHSCRAFRPEPLPNTLIEQVLTTAQGAPSWCNTQPWQLHITIGAGTDAFRAALLAHVDSESTRSARSDFPKPTAYTGRRLNRRRECGWALYKSVGVMRGDRNASARQARENYALFGAPHVAVVSSPRELGTYGAVDCGLWIASFLYAAQSRGIGTIAQAALASHAPFVRDYFAIPADHLVLCGVSFGWPDHQHPANAFRTSRAALNEVVTWVGNPR